MQKVTWFFCILAVRSWTRSLAAGFPLTATLIVLEVGGTPFTLDASCVASLQKSMSFTSQVIIDWNRDAPHDAFSV